MMPQSSPTFSIAIPAYNEAALLPRLLASIDAARANYRGGAEAIEVIVGDNASTDATAEIARAHGCAVAAVAKRAIAAARNGAATLARGRILCFVDADSIIHPDTFNQIERVLQSGDCVVGATGVKMERMSAGIACIWVLGLVMTRLGGLDSGVVFCRREDFATVGGYREDLLVAEDVDFLVRMKRLGRLRGQRFARTPSARTITSTRKFDRHGDWHFFRDGLLMPFRFLWSREAARRYALKYWYEDR